MVVVVNQPQNAPPDVTQQNLALLSSLKTDRGKWAFPLTLIGRVTKPIQKGVGEARKIGMDFAVSSLLKNPEDLIVSLDADSRVDENYLSYLCTQQLKGSAFTLRFEHPLEEAESPDWIACYELFLRYTKYHLARVGSPFAFYTIGSCLGTNVESYQRSGGMPARPATEDFHFLNKLRKYGSIEEWNGTCVYPSPRTASRVFLGTGFFLEQARTDFESAFQSLRIPRPKTFDRLGELLAAIRGSYHSPNSQLPDDLRERLANLRKNVTSLEAFEKRLSEVFDGLATFRFLKATGNGRFTSSQFLEACNETLRAQGLSWTECLRRWRLR